MALQFCSAKQPQFSNLNICNFSNQIAAAVSFLKNQVNYQATSQLNCQRNFQQSFLNCLAQRNSANIQYNLQNFHKFFSRSKIHIKRPMKFQTLGYLSELLFYNYQCQFKNLRTKAFLKIQTRGNSSYNYQCQFIQSTANISTDVQLHGKINNNCQRTNLTTTNLETS